MKARVRTVLFALALSLIPPLSHGTNTRVLAAKKPDRHHACIIDHAMLRTKPDRCRPRARTYPSSVTGRVERAIYDGALTFGVPYTVLLRIAECESALNPHASNGTHFGLFQFAPATFTRGARWMEDTTGVAAHSYWNPLDAAYVAGFLFAVGDAPSWQCEPPIPTPFAPPSPRYVPAR